MQMTKPILTNSLEFKIQHMKIKTTLLTLVLIWLVQSVQSQDFITEWTFPAAATQIRFNALTADGPVNYTWSASPSGNSGSGSFIQSTAGAVILSDLVIAAGDVVTLSMSPDNLRRFFINSGPDRSLLTNVIQWGIVPWASMESAFELCFNLQITATDVPELSNVSNTSQMFRSCAILNGPSNIGDWDTSAATNMSGMFFGAVSFNQDIGNWVTNLVEDMSFMFAGATAFNQDIGNWDTISATNFESMFRGAKAFNHDIGNWDTSNVINMSGMFGGTASFNQNVGNWDTSSVTNFESMFEQATAFNQNIGNWDTSSATNFERMFSEATVFNQDIGNWDTSAVNNMSFMFVESSFNQDIGNWNTSAVTTMQGMFGITTSFNQDISNWDTSSVTNMQSMFSGALAFNQNLSNWDISSVTRLSNMFRGANSFNQNLGSWTLNPDVVMAYMLDDSGIDCNNYSTTLVGWQTNNPDVINRRLGALGLTYGTAAVEARNILTNDRGWTIIGDSAGSEACDALLSDADFQKVAFAVYPNPAQNWFNINLNQSERYNVELISVTGQLVKRISDVQGILRIEVDNLPHGIYLVKVYNQQNNQTFQKKLIIQ